MSNEVSDRNEATKVEIPQSKKRIKDTPLRQQTVKAWQPIINIRTVWKFFLIIGTICIPVGATLLYFNTMTTEIRIEYTAECTSCSNSLIVKKGRCSKCIGASTTSDCVCSVSFKVPEDIKLPVYMYYEVDNFHQNHRRYVKSRDDSQLLGRIIKDNAPVEPSRLCQPFDKDKNGKFYFPCGAIANSMFSDVLKIVSHTGNEIMIKKDNIAWPDEKNNKFKNPPKIDKTNYFQNFTSATKIFNQHFIKPKEWSDSTYKDWWNNGGLQNELFVNWMHPSPSSRFRKLYGIIDSSKKVPGCKVAGVLCKNDNYMLSITYRFDVNRFKGKKSVILATTSFMGTRNPFLGYLALVLGVVTLIIGTVFFCINRHHSRRRVHPEHRRTSINHQSGVPVPDDALATELAKDLFTSLSRN